MHILEVDLEYKQDIHKIHCNVFSPEKIFFKPKNFEKVDVTTKNVKRLIPNLHNIHYVLQNMNKTLSAKSGTAYRNSKN